jgi:hypothetical protein
VALYIQRLTDRVRVFLKNFKYMYIEELHHGRSFYTMEQELKQIAKSLDMLTPIDKEKIEYAIHWINNYEEQRDKRAERIASYALTIRTLN